MADFPAPMRRGSRYHRALLIPPAPHNDAECFDDNTAVEFLEGTLATQEAARVERHAARCDTCRQLLAALGCSPSLDAEAPTVPLGSDAHLALERGEKVGRFMVLGRIGAGGMGVVFSAYDPKLDRKVALKLLRSPEDAISSATAAQMRLLREAQAMAQLSHPNVISVYDVGTYKSEVYIAMEFVEGETLTGWLRRWDRPWRDILDKFLAAGSALAEAHAGGLAHRDFKPDNVLVGNDERVRVMDFGLARSLFFEGPLPAPGDRQDSARTAGLSGPEGNMLEHPLTRTGALLGTPRYMAPEQLAGRETDARSDQFSFCVALYEALYKQHPFEDETAQELVKDPAGTRPRPPPANAGVPEWLHQALLRGLSAEARDRFPSMDTLTRALTPPAPKPARGHLMAALAVAAMGLMTSAYAVPALLDVMEDNDKITTELDSTRQRIEDLQSKINALIAHIGKLEAHLQQERSTAQDIEQRLRNALEELEQAERDLSALAPSRASARPPVRPPSRPRLAGLSVAQVLRPLQPIPYDVGICFREWLEREPGERVLFAVRLEIGPDGVPANGSKSGGIPDLVLQECVLPNIEQLRFPRTNAISVVHYKFYRSRLGGLEVGASVVDVLPVAGAAEAPSPPGSAPLPPAGP